MGAFDRVVPVALAVVLSACQPVHPASVAIGRPSVMVVAPSSSAGAAGVDLVDGSELVVRSGSETIRLSDGLAAAGSPCLSFDGGSVVFLGRRAGDRAARLFVATLDGGQRHELETGRDRPRAPAFLPDGGVVYATPIDGADTDGAGVCLSVVGGARSAATRITFGPGEARDPTLLADGRILFVDVAASGAAPHASDRLLAVHVDGTGVAPYADLPAGDWSLRRPRARSDGTIEVVATDRSTLPSIGPSVGATTCAERLLVLDPERTGDAPVVAAADAPPQTESPVASAPPPPAAGMRLLSAFIAGPRPRPSLHLSLVDPTQKSGELFGIDVRRSTIAALRDAPDGTVARIVLHRSDTAAPLGSANVAADGSFYVRVPADTPLTLELQDGAGRTLALERHAFWLRPGERRGCVGCHEERLSAPPNRRPLALLHDADVIPAPPVSTKGGVAPSGGGAAPSGGRP